MGRGPPGQGMPSPPRLPLGICSPLSPRTSAWADGLLLAEAPGNPGAQPLPRLLTALCSSELTLNLLPRRRL